MKPGGAADGPLRESVRNMGMFDVELSDTFLKSVRQSLDEHMRDEGMTIDQKLVVTRDEIDKEVQMALIRLRGHAYKKHEKRALTQAAVMSAIRQSLSNHITSPHVREIIDNEIHGKVMGMELVKPVKKKEKHGQRRQVNGHLGAFKRDKGGTHACVRRGEGFAKQGKKKGKVR